MGCFDSVMLNCPECSFENEFQSKSGPRSLTTYRLPDIPENVLVDVNRHAPIVCGKCGNAYEYSHILGRPVSSNMSTPEPAPIKNELPAVWDLVIQDMRDRDNFGFKKYGVRLQPNNGRSALRDAYGEALDLVVYLRSKIYEEENT